jgi:hypothetical protein
MPMHTHMIYLTLGGLVVMGCNRVPPPDASTPVAMSAMAVQSERWMYNGTIFDGTIESVAPIGSNEERVIPVGTSQYLAVRVSVASVIQGGAHFAIGDVVTFGIGNWYLLCAGPPERATGKQYRFSLDEHRFNLMARPFDP